MPQRPKDYTKGICGFWENLLGDQEAVCYSVTSWVLWRPILSRVFFITTYSVWNNAFMGVLNQTVKTVLIFRKPLKASLDHVWRLSLFHYFRQKTVKNIIGSRLETFNIPRHLPYKTEKHYWVTLQAFQYFVYQKILTIILRSCLETFSIP